MKKTSQQNQIQGILGALARQKYPITIYLLRDFLANLSRLLESGEDLMTKKGIIFLKYYGFYQQKDPDIFYSKMLKGYLIITLAKPSIQLSKKFLSWSMTVNGRCLTARISESPKTGNVSLLSDILEKNPDSKYFLSEKHTQILLSKLSEEV